LRGISGEGIGKEGKKILKKKLVENSEVGYSSAPVERSAKRK
jgi:hypothetical protein